MVDDPRYCTYHRFVGHPTRNCWSLKDRLEGLIQTRVLKLKPKQKRVSTNVTSTIIFGHNEPTKLTQMVPIPQVEMTGNNTDPYQQEQKGLVFVNLTNGEVCWVHPDLVDDDQPWV